MHYKKILKLLFTGVFASGCTLLGGGNKKTSNLADGGVFRSVDGAANWQQVIQIPTTDETRPTIGRVNVLKIAPDPQDRFALYLGTEGQGLYYTYTAGNGWRKAPVAEQSTIVDIVVDPTSKCRVYAAAESQVIKTTDCSRTWSGTYILNDRTKSITALDIDAGSTNIIYAGDIAGNVYKSFDYGTSWNTIARFDSAIKEIIVDPNATSSIYIATQRKGLRKSNDSGNTWVDISIDQKKFKGTLDFKRMILNTAEIDSLITSTKHGLFKTIDGGGTWNIIPLLTKPNEADIFGLAVNPENSDEIYYATTRTFYKSIDGGRTWSTKVLPTTRIPTALHIDPQNTEVLYMTVSNPLN